MPVNSHLCTLLIHSHTRAHTHTHATLQTRARRHTLCTHLLQPFGILALFAFKFGHFEFELLDALRVVLGEFGDFLFCICVCVFMCMYTCSIPLPEIRATRWCPFYFVDVVLNVWTLEHVLFPCLLCMHASADAHGVRVMYDHCIFLHMLVNITARVKYTNAIWIFPLFRYIYMYTYMCIYLYLYVYIYTHICIHMHT